MESCQELSSRKKSIFGKPRIKGQLGSLFTKYDPWGPGLDAMEVFLENWEAVSRKMIIQVFINDV